jgi:hypothetical protein
METVEDGTVAVAHRLAARQRRLKYIPAILANGINRCVSKQPLCQFIPGSNFAIAIDDESSVRRKLNQIRYIFFHVNYPVNISASAIQELNAESTSI